jgi:hypothetical protein
MDKSQQYADVRFAAENAIINLELALRHVEAGLARRYDERPSADLEHLKNELREAALEFSHSRFRLLHALDLHVKATFVGKPRLPAITPEREPIHGNS